MVRVAVLAEEIGVPVQHLVSQLRQRGLTGVSAASELTEARARALRRAGARPSKEPRRQRSTKSRLEMPSAALSPNERLAWLQLPLPVYDPPGVARVLSNALIVREPRLVWDREAERLVTYYWRKAPTRTGAKKSRGDPEADYGVSTTELLSGLAAKLGLSPSALYRLVTKPKSLSWLTARRLKKALDEDEWRELQPRLLGPRVRRVLDEYVAYLNREVDRLSARRSGKHGLHFAPEELKAVRDLETVAKRLGAAALRARLAVFRAADSFVGWRPLRESLTRPERSSMLQAGLRRERNILRVEMRVLRDELEAARKLDLKSRGKERLRAVSMKSDLHDDFAALAELIDHDR